MTRLQAVCDRFKLLPMFPISENHSKQVFSGFLAIHKQTSKRFFHKTLPLQLRKYRAVLEPRIRSLRTISILCKLS